MGGARGQLLCLCFLAGLGRGLCGRVLLVVMPGDKSPLFNMKKLGTYIASTGHQIAYLATDGDAPLLQPTNSPILAYSPVKSDDVKVVKLEDIKHVGPQSTSPVLQFLELLGASCDALMSNAAILAKVKEFNPELLIGPSTFTCLQVLSSKLDLPFVNFIPAGPIDPVFSLLWRGTNHRAAVPNPLSYLPQIGMTVTSQHLSFPQRVKNTLHFLAATVMVQAQINPRLVATFKRHGVDVDSQKERERCALTIVAADFVLEWLRPLPPSLKFVGPLLPEPARPLPADLEVFMETAGDQGVLLVATGTLATLGLKERVAMAAAFAQLPVKVLWKLSKSEVPDEAALGELKIGSNTEVVSWLPQNDVLGHPHMRAFLSHCGANSLYEAAYHGVPVIGLPFFGDQPGNADKAMAKGFAVRISHADLTGKGLEEAVLDVLGYARYATEAAGVSRKLRARKRTPVQEAAEWVEHVLATGGEAYLRTPDEDLSWLARMGIDVVVAYLGALHLLAFLIWRMGRALWHCLSAFLAKEKTS